MQANIDFDDDRGHANDTIILARKVVTDVDETSLSRDRDEEETVTTMNVEPQPRRVGQTVPTAVMPTSLLPTIPAKRYFTIGEVSDLCGVKSHVLRYWEQEFTQLKSITRRGNRRYYQHHEVLLIRRIRELLYEHGFTIQGARNRLDTEKRDSTVPAAEREPLPPLIDRARLKAQLFALRDWLDQGA